MIDEPPNWPATGIYNMQWCRICPHPKSKYNKNGIYDLNDPEVQKYLGASHQEDQINLLVDETSAILYWTCKREFDSWRVERPGAELASVSIGDDLDDRDEFESEYADQDAVGALWNKLNDIKPICVGLNQMQELVNTVGITADVAELTKCLYKSSYEPKLEFINKEFEGYMDQIEKIANMIGEEEYVGAGGAPMSHKVVPYVFEHLSQTNSGDLKFERVEGDSILFTVVVDGKSHQYKMKIEYAGSTEPEQVDPNVRAKQMRRGAAEAY